MVDRWGSMDDMVLNDIGLFVYYHDYKELEAKLDMSETAVAECHDEIRRLEAMVLQLQNAGIDLAKRFGDAEDAVNVWKHESEEAKRAAIYWKKNTDGFFAQVRAVEKLIESYLELPPGLVLQRDDVVRELRSALNSQVSE